MHIHLNQGRITNAAEAMDLPGLDDENVTRAGFELLAVDGPETSAFSHELDFIVRMAMGARTTSGQGSEEEDGDVDVAVIGPDELMRAALEWQVLLTNAVYPAGAPTEVGYGERSSGRSHCEGRSPEAIPRPAHGTHWIASGTWPLAMTPYVRTSARQTPAL
jgi:hypothetical protein